MIADHNLVKKSFGPMIADHDLAIMDAEVSTHTFLTMIIEESVCFMSCEPIFFLQIFLCGTHGILYVIQLSDRVYNVTFPAYALYSLRLAPQGI
jgi:hypothetical protein